MEGRKRRRGLVKSITDVITNSSTEVFVLARKQGDKRPWEEIIDAITQHHNLHMVNYETGYNNPDKHGLVDRYSGEVAELEVKEKGDVFLELWFDEGFESLDRYLTDNFKKIRSYYI